MKSRNTEDCRRSRSSQVRPELWLALWLVALVLALLGPWRWCCGAWRCGAGAARCWRGGAVAVAHGAVVLALCKMSYAYNDTNHTHDIMRLAQLGRRRSRPACA